MSIWSAPFSATNPTGDAVDGRDEGQASGEPRAEGRLVVGRGRPGRLLRLAVILARQLLDARLEDLGERGTHRPAGTGAAAAARGRAGASSRHLPGGGAVLVVLDHDAHAASSSRMRSDSAKFFAARAALRDAISASTLAGIDPERRLPARRPGLARSQQEAERAQVRARARRHAPRPSRACSSASIFGVLRSSASASSTASAKRGAPAVGRREPYQRSSVLLALLRPRTVQSIGWR